MSRFIQAEQGLNHSVIYTDDSGRFFRFSGGTWTWRNHNPGNLVPGKVSKRHSQIGVAGHFAVFPNKEHGHAALLDCLRTTYANASIPKLVERFAPAKDGNNVEIYTKFLRDKTGVLDNKPVERFTVEEFDKLWRAIEQMEGYKEGVITEIFPVIEVHKNNTGIYGYHVKKQGWCSKPECIQLTKQDKLDLIIVTSRMGHDYLRARAGSSVNGSLSHMVVKDKNKGSINAID